MAYEIDGTTRLLALLGNPVAHSQSPRMHNTACRALSLPYVYLAFESGVEQLPDMVSSLVRLHARGWNLTMPVKNDMVPLCDRLSPVASVIGAVNTVVVEDDGSLSGYSTDGAGFFRAVREAGVSVRGEKLTLFGAGGAGSAILAQAAYEGVREISVFCRPSSRFAARLHEISDCLMKETSCSIRILPYENTFLQTELSSSALLVNATNVGMLTKDGKEDTCLVPDPSFLPKELVVADCIYHPEETKLLSMAKEAGCLTIPGLSMLLYQGAEAFRLWTGEEMPIELGKREVTIDR